MNDNRLSVINLFTIEGDDVIRFPPLSLSACSMIVVNGALSFMAGCLVQVFFANCYYLGYMPHAEIFNCYAFDLHFHIIRVNF